jgi:aminopeptidase YwaD
MPKKDGRLVRHELSGSIAKSYVSQITRFHRIQGSVMFHEAALHVVDELRRIGMRDAELLQFPADGRQKFWTHRSSLGWKVKSAELRLIKPKEELLATFHDIPTSLHTLSQGTPKEGVTAELVDVGAGNSKKHFKGKRVKGKIVLAKGSAHSVHVEAVVKRGAAGVITDTLAFEFPKVRESIDVPDAHCYQSIWPTSDNVKKIKFGFSLSKRQGDELRSYLASGQKVILRARVDAKLFPGKYDIVTATIRGSSKPEEEIFLIAHLCHPKPGANDNASGSGLLMEIARTLTALIRSGKMKRPSRTIRFLWVPETTGTVALLSSRPDMRGRFVAGLNLDMVGEDQEACKSTLHVGVTPDSLPSYLNDLVMSVMEDSAKELDPLNQIGLPSNFRYVRSSFSAGSDHAEFVEPTVGVPCVSFTQWPDKFYHTSMDTIDRVSEDSLRRIGWTSAIVALKLANANQRTAMELASLTCSRGSARIAEASAKASQDLFGVMDDIKKKDKVQKLARLVRNHRGRIEHIVKREQEAVRSVSSLDSSKELQDFVDALVADLATAGQRELAGLERAIKIMERGLKQRIPAAPRQTEAERESKRLVPKRRFKGTLAWTLLPDSLDEEGAEAYRKIEKSDREFMSKTAELVNYINGRRTIHEITEALSAEYGPTNPAHVLRYLRDLCKIKLVTL